MVQFPAFVNGQPPVVSLKEYDDAEWAQETAVDNTPDGYVAVNMNTQKIVAKFDKESESTLDTIFNSAKKQYVSENLEDVLKQGGKK
ncbi:hypothetical protein BN7_5270 [Wickerhamomyces ciferrii]|uniref:Uncharacterized protein n=1 Tax=Wickerhamomyces ciferrii (strain ATCC 14091 / BCRC 22168 / CBS 111 / JCM 3599 / NBRC 0793 / NRRL Y-1031 F-60-10) TaxID=1206466 RepID=K0KKD9_WICCF|nr:uncharacterized protein BN7_5270 [Wickerhamomyces ciferrii]CCH45685.1 hypothetical protein BN7_5270 [Wickerhamomyces ciferrii]